MSTNKSFACPYCNKRFSRQDLVSHLEKIHSSELPEGFSPLRTAFHIVNRKDFDYRRPCRICKKPTEWDENKGRYNFLCEDPNCKKKWITNMKKTMGDKYGAFRPTSSPEGLEKMLAGRKISGKYKFQDGIEFTYTGSYELEALKFMDLVLNVKSEDIQMPAPIIEYPFRGSTHIYIPDIYYRPYNLLIEVKDGGSRPNKNQNYSDTRARQMAKENYVINHTNYNYLRLTDNDFSQLLGVFADLKMHLIEQDNSRVIHVNENMFGAMQSMIPPVNTNDTIIVNYGLNNVFNPSKYAIADNLKFDNLIYRDPNGVLRSTVLESKQNEIKLYHLSEADLDKKILKPQIPDNYFTKNGFEDAKTPRVCFSKSIDGALKGLSQNLDGKILNVYIADNISKNSIYTPTINQVPDAKITDEVWVLSDCKLRYVGKILVSEDKNNKGYKFSYGPNKSAVLYGWNYEWLEDLTENSLFNRDDLEYKINEFKHGNLNLALVVGFSGSGKTTLGKELNKEVPKSHIYPLDVLMFHYDYNEKNLAAFGNLFNDFFKKNAKFRLSAVEAKTLQNPLNYFRDLVFSFLEFAKSYAKNNKNEKIIIEGIWPLYYNFKPEWYKEDWCVVIKGTSYFISEFRAMKRDTARTQHPLLEKIFRIITHSSKDYISRVFSVMNRNIDSWYTYYNTLNKINESSGSEISNFFKVLRVSKDEEKPYRSFIVKDILTDEKIEQIHENLNKWVPPEFIYETVFGHGLYSNNQIEFEKNCNEYDYYSETIQLAESVSDFIKNDEGQTDKQLLNWMTRNIKYTNFSKLKSHEEVMKTKSGSCHDQVVFELIELSEYRPRGLFIIEYNDDENAPSDGDQVTHSLVYYNKNNKTCWFEHAWDGMEGIHEFKNLKELKNKLEELHKQGKFGNYKKYPKLEITPFRHKRHKSGETLQQLVDICLGGDN